MRFLRVVMLLAGLIGGMALPAWAAGGPIDINRASVAQLETLPGIADATASLIVRNRPYRNKRQLLSKKVISVAAYRKIQDKIVAKQ